MHRTRKRMLAALCLALVGTLATTQLHAQSDQDILDAAGSGNVGMISTLLRLQANPNAADSMGYTTVMYAAQMGHTEAVEALLDAGADINAVSTEGWTPLLLTALQGQAETATALMGRGADATVTFGGGFTALMVGSARGHVEVVEALVTGGSDLEAKLPDGRTALMAAAESGHLGVIEKLIELGADVNAEANGGGTAAVSAMRNGHLNVIPALAEAGAIFMAGFAGVESPSAPSCPNPQWPESLWEAEIDGQVIVEFVVDREGEVEDGSVVMISTPHPDLEEASIEMFSNCSFDPGKVDGTEVRVRLRQGLNVGG